MKLKMKKINKYSFFINYYFYYEYFYMHYLFLLHLYLIINNLFLFHILFLYLKKKVKKIVLKFNKIFNKCF